MKKSFILFNDSLDILDDISIEQAGKLFIAIRNFNIGKEQPLDSETKLLFLHFKNQFIRDLEKYKTKSETNKDNGSKGGLAKVANATKRKRTLKTLATLADTDTVTDTDTKIEFSEFWKLYPRKEEKKTAVAKWDKLPKETQQKIIQTLPAFLNGKDVKFVPMPVTYLNNERWDDELTHAPTLTESEINKQRAADFISRL